MGKQCLPLCRLSPNLVNHFPGFDCQLNRGSMSPGRKKGGGLIEQNEMQLTVLNVWMEYNAFSHCQGWLFNRFKNYLLKFSRGI